MAKKTSLHRLPVRFFYDFLAMYRPISPDDRGLNHTFSVFLDTLHRSDYILTRNIPTRNVLLEMICGNPAMGKIPS